MGEPRGGAPANVTATTPPLPSSQLAGLADHDEGSMLGIVAGCGVGLLILGGLVIFILHFSDEDRKSVV